MPFLLIIDESSDCESIEKTKITRIFDTHKEARIYANRYYSYFGERHRAGLEKSTKWFVIPIDTLENVDYQLKQD